MCQEADVVMQWIVAGLTLAGVLVALLQPIFGRRRERKEKAERLRAHIALYVAVLEDKLVDCRRMASVGRLSGRQTGWFEDENRRNYQALEDAASESDILKQHERQALLSLVRHFKLSKNIDFRPENTKDVEGALGHFRTAQSVFPLREPDTRLAKRKRNPPPAATTGPWK